MDRRHACSRLLRHGARRGERVELPRRDHAELAGKWKGHYGGAVSGHFTIHWRKTGSRLHGNITLSNPQGTYGISGSVHNGKIKFGAVSVGAKYKGTVRGTSMSGTWTSPQGGGSWSAPRPPDVSKRPRRRSHERRLGLLRLPAPLGPFRVFSESLHHLPDLLVETRPGSRS